MLSSAADLAQLAGTAPWLAVGVLCLAAAAWVYRQARKGIAAAQRTAAASATRQGTRLGDLEKRLGLIELRRQQVEWVLLDLAVPLPYWPPDGPEQPRPRRTENLEVFDPEEETELYTQERRVPVPPLPADVAARHRRP